jgi:benzoyl-CoA reductase subunit A
VIVLARNAPGGGDGEAKAISKIFEKMLAEPEVVFGGLADDRSRFFRDAAGGRFLTDAEMASRDKKLSFEVAAGAYDRAIVEIENAEREWEPSKLIDRALELVPVGNAEAAAVREAWYSSEVKLVGMVGTGYGRQRLPFPKESIRSEILCHGLGAHAFFPETRTVLDIGGQDTKAIQVDGSGIVTSFQMNDRCAAGCGRYLGYIADEMNLGVHELGPIALTARRPAKITSTCTVFAGVELRELLSLGERRENILLGLHRAIVLRAMSLLARSGGVKEEMTFTGGVARNVAVVQELRDLVKRHYGERKINIHTDSIYTGALGAAIFAKRAAHAEA